MATATASSTSSAVASTGTGADDNYAATGQSTDSGADGQGTADTLAGDLQAQAPASTAAAEPGGDDHCSSDPLRAERRKSNQLEKEIRTLRQQLNRFSEINPEEYARLQEAERQKQILTS